MFPDLAEMRVVDLGGTVAYWRRAPVRPRHVHVINLDSSDVTDLPPWIEFDSGDVCDPESPVLTGSYDLVYSNSVIEHLGGHEQRRRFADVSLRLAQAHWIQTPYRYFPIEPHWVCPGMQFMPLAMRARVGQHWPLVHTRPPNYRSALDAQLQVELLTLTHMRRYFPDSLIERERIAGVVKSIIAVQRPD